MKFRRISKVLCLHGLQKKLWAQFHNLCVQKWSGLLWSSDTFWNFSPFKLYKKSSLSAFSRFMLPKMKLFAVEFRHILEVLCLRVLQKKFWVQFDDLCVQKWSGLLWSSDAFWKLSPCMLYKKSSECIFPIYVSKNEAVCHGVQTHFGSSLPANFTEKFLAQFRDLCVKTRSCLPWNSDAFWKFSAGKIYRKVVGAIPRFARPKMKLFAVKFWCILKVLCPQGLQKKLRVQFHDLCVQKWSSLLWSSDSFWKLSPFKLHKKSSGRIFPIYASKNEAVCLGVQTHFGSSLWLAFPSCIYTRAVVLNRGYTYHLGVRGAKSEGTKHQSLQGLAH